MKFAKPIFLLSVLTTSVTLLLAYSLERFWLGAFLAVGLGFLGWLGQPRRKGFWSSELYFSGAIILVTIGSLFGLKLHLLLPALLGAMATWDLGRFQQRLEDEPASEIVLRMEKRHLYFLVFTLTSGAIFSAIVLTFQMQLSFSVVLTLGVILIISFGQIFRLLRN